MGLVEGLELMRKDDVLSAITSKEQSLVTMIAMANFIILLAQIMIP